jgi:hypothetical protein
MKLTSTLLNQGLNEQSQAKAHQSPKNTTRAPSELQHSKSEDAPERRGPSSLLARIRAAQPAYRKKFNAYTPEEIAELEKDALRDACMEGGSRHA